MESISISEFKAICLRLLDKINKTGEPITVTKNGEPLVVVYPAPSDTGRAKFGDMKEGGKILGDIVEPASNPNEWEVLK